MKPLKNNYFVLLYIPNKYMRITLGVPFNAIVLRRDDFCSVRERNRQRYAHQHLRYSR